MDDIKKAIYLDVLSSLKEEDYNTYICPLLLFYLEDIFGIQSAKQYPEVLYEFFPEFFALNDGYKYGYNNRWPIEADDAWFTPLARYARLSTINFIITNR